MDIETTSCQSCGPLHSICHPALHSYCLFTIAIMASAAKPAATASPATTTTTTTPTTIPTTTDGSHYEPATGLVAGMHTAAVVAPPMTPGLASLPADCVFDVIVLGAGYAGLTAARDAAVSGLRP